jgi:hypothetical protein
MAIVSNGTQVLISDGKIPNGYTKPTVTTFDDEEATYKDFVITVDKSTIENADAVVAFTALVAAIGTAVDALLATNYTTNTGAAYVNFKDVINNQLFSDNSYYKTNTLSLKCTVDIFVRVD